MILIQSKTSVSITSFSEKNYHMPEYSQFILRSTEYFWWKLCIKLPSVSALFLFPPMDMLTLGAISEIFNKIINKVSF